MLPKILKQDIKEDVYTVTKLSKKLKGKSTRRLKITEHFIESTECLEEIYKIL